MQASGSSQLDPEKLERELRYSLYRFDCPDAHTLGEYQLDMLDESRRVRVAAHAASCDECRAELHTLRAFLAAPLEMPASLPERARRLVATLLRPRPGLAFGGLRGAADTSTRVFEAGDVTLTIGPGPASGSLYGLVVAAGSAPEVLEGREARLISGDRAPVTSRVDDLGNFEFADVRPGAYVLEVDVPDGVVVIEELRVQ
ncbi:MAG TPA: hypothetical protein VF937_02765 [Chloroflexota bacterium]